MVEERAVPSIDTSAVGNDGQPLQKLVKQTSIVTKTEHVDIIKDTFWKAHPSILDNDIYGDVD